VLYPFFLSHHPSPIQLGFSTLQLEREEGILDGFEVRTTGAFVGDATGSLEGIAVFVGATLTGVIVGTEEVITGTFVGPLVTGILVGVLVGDTIGVVVSTPDL
jgi:hypothetical protein